MRKLFLLLTLIPLISFGQENFLKEYSYADSLIQSNQIDSGYLKLKELEAKIPDSDTLYDYTLWYLTGIVTHLESISRSSEDFQSSLDYGLEALELIKKGIKRFDSEFAKREPFMIKNVVVSYFGLGDYAKGQEYKDLLYNFFTLDDKNIWGYEWFAELPKDRFSSSFTKVVYYVYSTNPDGSDKDQLYRLHVLMFHGDNEHFDYVMDKRLDTATDEISGTLYSYTYKEDIDYKKLHNDVIQIVKGNLQPDTKRTTSKIKNKNGQIEVEVELNNE